MPAQQTLRGRIVDKIEAAMKLIDGPNTTYFYGVDERSVYTGRYVIDERTVPSVWIVVAEEAKELSGASVGCMLARLKVAVLFAFRCMRDEDFTRMSNEALADLDKAIGIRLTGMTDADGNAFEASVVEVGNTTSQGRTDGDLGYVQAEYEVTYEHRRGDQARSLPA